MNRSVAILMRGGVAVIDAEADIRRSAGEVFDYASDPANEPEWNIRMKRIEKLTGGPVGVGARYRMEFTQGPPAVSECVRFERPAFWELAGGSKIISSGFSGRVVFRGDGSHLLLRMQIRLRGPLRWALPLVRRRMRRELARDVATIKERLEGAAPASAGHRPAKRVREDQRRRVVAEFLARKRTTGTRPLAGRRVMKQQRVSEAALSRRLGGSGEPVPGGHAAGVEPDQRGPGREARDTFRHDPVRGDGPGGSPAGESWRAGVSRRWRGWLVGEVAGAGFRVIAPSRFGYFGSSLPPGATPAAQADAYPVLLDHLGIGRAIVLAFSAGSGSVLEFGLRHRDRVIGLVLANCRLGGGSP